ncbi:MAG: asparagine synthase-related protein [Acidimicrobiia bacterium]|nr:asparagine synthase-related protein [Acidimicrobiia bacterium]
MGLSGGVDSSLVAAVAVDALGPDHVHGVLMPSRHSSEHSVSDAEQLCRNLGIENRTVVIEPAHEAMVRMLAPSFDASEGGVGRRRTSSRASGGSSSWRSRTGSGGWC